MNLQKMGLLKEDVLQRSQLVKIQVGGDASDYCVSLYVISLCNDLDLDAGTDGSMDGLLEIALTMACPMKLIMLRH